MMIVTGGAHGIGFAIAQRLATDGARLALIDDGADALSEAADTLAAEGAAEVLGLSAELTNGRSVADAFASVADSWSSANGLITTAPPAARRAEGFIDEHVWEDAFDGGIVAAVRCVRLAVPLLRAARWGRIVTVLDTPAEGSPSASAVALALSVFVKRLARTVRGHGILVNLVSPAGLLSGPDDDVVLAAGSELGDVFASLADRAGALLNTGRSATAEELAEVVAHCASPRNRSMTGQHLTVDAMEPSR
jgi:NAD(P)-dependent dehydrogenase (short-subunit alcohol dehydrogenase family)